MMRCVSKGDSVEVVVDSGIEGESTLDESRRCGSSSRNARAELCFVVGERMVPDTSKMEGAFHLNTDFSKEPML